MTDDFRDSIREARAGLGASSPKPVTDPPIVMTDDDRQRIAELWWAGRLSVGDRVVLESGHGVTCCAVEVGGDEPPHLTFRADPDLSSVRISFVIAGVPE